MASLRKGEKTAEILLIDPHCHGAVLRSFSERAGAETTPGRLENDVLEAASYLRSLRKELSEVHNIPRDNLQVRLYSLTPTMFLCQLDNMTFTQIYHFWNARRAGSPVPVFVWKQPERNENSLSMYNEMAQHFEFIWKSASISLDEFLPTSGGGLDWGAHVAGTSSVFIDKLRPNARMAAEIRRSKRVWIQGITLNHFLSEPHSLPCDQVKGDRRRVRCARIAA